MVRWACAVSVGQLSTAAAWKNGGRAGSTLLTGSCPTETQHFDLGRTATGEKWSDLFDGYDASLTSSDAQACRSEVALEASRHGGAAYWGEAVARFRGQQVAS